MKYLLLSLLLFSFSAMAENESLTPEQQQQLLKDMQNLKLKVGKLEAEKGSDADQAKAEKMLETIKRGRDYQENQQKALEELDAE
jgi:hypothetical protein